jgi:hypothetical protein
MVDSSLSCVNDKVMQMVKGPQQQKSTVKGDVQHHGYVVGNN